MDSGAKMRAKEVMMMMEEEELWGTECIPATTHPLPHY
jgi:hypothetical protein